MALSNGRENAFTSCTCGAAEANGLSSCGARVTAITRNLARWSDIGQDRGSAIRRRNPDAVRGGRYRGCAREERPEEGDGEAETRLPPGARRARGPLQGRRQAAGDRRPGPSDRPARRRHLQELLQEVARPRLLAGLLPR